jgi:hypothetical protein
MKICIILLMFIPFWSFTQNSVVASAQYLYRVYHPGTEPTYYEGSRIGTVMTSQGEQGYYQKKWSKVYTLNFRVFSGKNLNDAFKQSRYNDLAIIFIVEWSNGGFSLIEINNYSFHQGIDFTKVDFKGKSLTGIDDDDRYWEITVP